MTDQPFFRRYTQLATESDLVEALRRQADEVIAPWLDLDDNACQMLHPPYTWTIREVMGHMIDTEIIFTYRALRFSRNDPTSLPGFDEGSYVAASSYRTQPIRQTVEWLLAVRCASVCLFQSMTPEAWSRTGQASGMVWSVTDLCQATIGHLRHHARIMEQRLSS